jgi:hypothetical protein
VYDRPRRRSFCCASLDAWRRARARLLARSARARSIGDDLRRRLLLTTIPFHTDERDMRTNQTNNNNNNDQPTTSKRAYPNKTTKNRPDNKN